MKNAKIWYNGNQFDKINKFDCRVIDLDNFFTCLPISSAEFRAKHPTKAKVEIIQNDRFTIFLITDDWGDTKSVRIPNTMQAEIQKARQAAIDQNLIKK